MIASNIILVDLILTDFFAVCGVFKCPLKII